MEGGQKANISLTSGIDTQSNDMLISVGSPKFLHNRQKMQGRYMPNSVRYEHDGWAVDNDVYEFEKVDIQVDTSPKGYRVERQVLSSAVSLYRFVIKDENGNKVGSFKYTPKSSGITGDDTLSIPVSDTLTAVVKYNRQTKQWELVSGDNCELEVSWDNQYVYTLTVTNKAKSYENKSFTFKKGTDIEIAGTKYALEEQTATESLYSSGNVSITADSSEVKAIKRGGTALDIVKSKTNKIGIPDNTTIALSPSEEKFVVYFNNVNSTEKNKTISSRADEKSPDSYLSAMIYGEEYKDVTQGNSTQKEWVVGSQPILAYDSDAEGEPRYRVRLDVSVPVWGGISFLKGVNINTEGATEVSSSVDILEDCQGKIRLTPGVCSGGVVTRYDKTVIGSNIKVWNQCEDVTSLCSLSVISPMKLQISYVYYKVAPKAITKTVAGVEVATGDCKYVATAQTGTEEIEFDKWGWTVPSIELLLGADGLQQLFSFDTTFTVVKQSDSDYDYGIANVGKLVAGTFSVSLKLRSDGKDFGDSSYYHTDVSVPSNGSVWVAHTAASSGYSKLGTYDVSFWGCLSDGKIQAYKRNTSGSAVAIGTFGAAGTLAFCYRGVFSQSLYLEQSVVKSLKPSSSYAAEDFELKDSELTSFTTDNCYDISGLFCLEVSRATFGVAKNEITLSLVKKGDEEEYIFYPKSEVNVTKTRWGGANGSTFDIESQYAPEHFFTGSVGSATGSETNMEAITILKNVGSSISSNVVTLALDTITPIEKKYIASLDFKIAELQVLKYFNTPEVDKHISMLQEGTTIIGVPTVTVTTTSNGVTAVVSDIVKIVATSDDADIKDFPLDVTITHNGEQITGITTTKSSVTDKSTFDLTYTPSVADKEIKVAYIAYLAYVLGSRYEIIRKDTGASLDARYKDGIAFATVDSVKIGYGFSKLRAYLTFDTNTESLSEYELTDEEYTVARNDIGTVITFNVFEKAVKTGITIDTLYEVDGVESASIDSKGEVLFKLDGNYNFNISKFEDKSQKSYLKYMYTRTYDENDERINLGKQYTDGEYQFLKQQWNTNVDVENFWWLDSSHILVLTQKEIKVLKKTDVLDDWAADKWEEEAVYNRFDYLTKDVLSYIVPNIKGDAAATLGGVLVTFEKKTSTTFVIRVYSPLDEMSEVSTEMLVNKIEIGEKLNADTQALNSYTTLVLENVLSQAKFTGTLIGNKILIGLHLDKNFNQWTMVFDRELSTKFIVQGYGFVGIDGLLTGGEIPKDYFSTSGYLGFNSKVEDISVLGGGTTEDKQYISDLSELSSLTERVVGTADQQWYITTKLQNIVSHITVNVDSSNNITFVPEYLPITNKYSVGYNSGSFCSSVLGDMNFQFRGIQEIMQGVNNSGWQKFLSLALSPQLCFWAGRFTTLVYLQQTLGQAAYVHYNSTSIHQSQELERQDSAKNYIPEKAEIKELEEESRGRTGVTSDSIAFDYQSVRQTGRANTGAAWQHALLLIASSMIGGASSVATEKMKVNSMKNLNTASDYGKAFGTYFIENLASAAISDFVALDINPKETSEVSALKTLDMFYSTSGEQKVEGGSGWVNHNLVAQCTAQSVTSIQLEARQQRYLFILSAITMLEVRFAYEASVVLLEALKDVTDNSSAGLNVIAGFASGGNFGEVATHFAAAAGLVAANTQVKALETILEELPKILSALGADELHTNVSSVMTKHNVDIEASHKYGTKNEYFMYPCWNCNNNSYIDETVSVGIKNKKWYIDLETHKDAVAEEEVIDIDFSEGGDKNAPDELEGDMNYYIAGIQGASTKRLLPKRMACVEGVKTFLPNVVYKNENLGESEPVFNTPPFQDYIIDEEWEISRTASVGMTTWISCKDTKLIDGEESNICITSDFCGVASPYAAIEVKRGIEMKYLRPFALTPKVLALNCTGYNCLFDERMYHAFDGYGYRLVNWRGESGLAKGNRVFQYSFLKNDRFKRSNKMPHNTFFGDFKSDPVLALPGTIEDKVFSLVTVPEEGRGLIAGAIGEDKDTRRYSLPVFTEYVSTLPAVVKTISSYNLSVIDGVTTLTAENHDLQSAYKAPTSVDFAIGNDKYRYTEEYICSLEQTQGITIVEQLCPCIGLTYLGATPTEALFYSKDNKQYYKYAGGKNVQLVSMVERFRNIISGRYDFINQEIIVPALSNFKRLDDKVEDDEDETDNVIVLRLNGQEVEGEISPPLDTIYKTKEVENFPSWFRTLSLPMGLTYQGPNRCIVNRFIVNEYMLKEIRGNYGKWKRVPKEEYHPFREYEAKFESVEEFIGDDVKVKGWTHNPFLLVTAPLGVSEETDCMFEWNITFVWTKEMDMLYNKNEYAVVNLLAETMTVGGKVIASRPTHIYLTKELFTRTGNYGYYSFRYQSNCGAGNRERLHIWSDQYIAISDLTLEYKPVTQRHNDILTQQVDVSELTEV